MSARRYGGLTATEVRASVGERSVLCIPIGSYEQHGAHLPIETDTILAQGFTERLIARYGEEFDLWSTPAIPYGLSLEHAWSPGTVSMTARAFVSLLDAVVTAYVQASPLRNMLIVNGHGGNRGVLEAVLYELQRDHRVNPCVIHPSSLSTAKFASSLPEVHAGLRETSVMLALSPDDVHIDRIPADYEEDQSQKELVRRLVLDRGTTWPWTSGDPGISAFGIMGSDPRNATSELGEAVLASALDNSRAVLETLLDRKVGTNIMAD
jgi:creatinine amidohydrolase/Fe(II)-dependent formamide hydrolase-like protein